MMAAASASHHPVHSDRPPVARPSRGLMGPYVQFPMGNQQRVAAQTNPPGEAETVRPPGLVETTTQQFVE